MRGEGSKLIGPKQIDCFLQFLFVGEYQALQVLVGRQRPAPLGKFRSLALGGPAATILAIWIFHLSTIGLAPPRRPQLNHHNRSFQEMQRQLKVRCPSLLPLVQRLARTQIPEQIAHLLIAQAFEQALRHKRNSRYAHLRNVVARQHAAWPSALFRISTRASFSTTIPVSVRPLSVTMIDVS